MADDVIDRTRMALTLAASAIERDARLSELTDDEMRSLAKAALAEAVRAMMEPGDDTLEAGQNLCNDAYLDPDEVPADAYFVWQAMLTAWRRESGV